MLKLKRLIFIFLPQTFFIRKENYSSKDNCRTGARNNRYLTILGLYNTITYHYSHLTSIFTHSSTQNSQNLKALSALLMMMNRFLYSGHMSQSHVTAQSAQYTLITYHLSAYHLNLNTFLFKVQI